MESFGNENMDKMLELSVLNAEKIVSLVDALVEKGDCEALAQIQTYLSYHSRVLEKESAERFSRDTKELVVNGKHLCVKSLLGLGIDPEGGLLWSAIQYGDMEMVKIVIEGGAKFDGGQGDGERIDRYGQRLHDPRKGWIIYPLFLLESTGFSLAYLHKGITAVPYSITAVLAFDRGDPRILEYLLSDISAFNFRKMKLVQNSIWQYPGSIKSPEVVDILIRHGYTIDGDDQPKWWDNESGGGTSSVLAEAILNENQELIDYLLDQKKVGLLWYWKTEIWAAFEKKNPGLLRRLLVHQKSRNKGWFEVNKKGLDSRGGGGGGNVKSLMFEIMNAPDTVVNSPVSLQFIDILLEYGVDIYKTGYDEFGHEGTPLSQALSAGGKVIELFLKHGLDPNAKLDGVSIFYLALDSGDFDTAEALLAAGVDLDKVDPKGLSALVECASHVAKSSGAGLRVLKRLLEAGKDPNVVTKDLDRPLRSIVREVVRSSSCEYFPEQGIQAIELLCRAGADPNFKVYAEEPSLVALAIEYDRAEYVNVLKQCGAQSEDVSDLMFAVDSDDPDRVRAQLKQKGDKEDINQYLLHAVDKNKLRSLRELLQAGADPNYRIESSEYEIIINRAKSLEGIEILLASGADPNASVRGSEEKILDTLYEDIEKFQLLLRSGADPRRCYRFDEITRVAFQVAKGYGRDQAEKDWGLVKDYLHAAHINIENQSDINLIKDALTSNGDQAYYDTVYGWFDVYLKTGDMGIRDFLHRFSSSRDFFASMRDVPNIDRALKENNYPLFRAILSVHSEPGVFKIKNIENERMYRRIGGDAYTLALNLDERFLKDLLSYKVQLDEQDVTNIVRGLLKKGDNTLAKDFAKQYHVNLK